MTLRFSRKPVFCFIIFLLVLCVCEAGARLAYWGVSGERYNAGKIAELQKDVIGQPLNERPWWRPHPYLGLLPSTGHNPSTSINFRGKAIINEFGFLSPGESFLDHSSDTVNVVITGGSLALECSLLSGQRLADQLGKIPQFQHRKINIVTLAMNRFKQPQQLISLLYYQMLGGRVDLLINLDGYNDIVHGQLQGATAGLDAALYPLYWDRLSTHIPSDHYMQAKLDSDALARRQRAFTKFFNVIPGQWALPGVFWSFGNSYLAQQKARVTLDWEDVDQNVPPALHLTDLKARELGIKAWLEGSRDMQAIATIHHIPYFHFLQPNQYVPDSKQFNEFERFVHRHIRRPAEANIVKAGYSQMQAGIVELQKSGIHAYDLTGLYKQETGTIYIDSCCHVNKHGTELIVNAIAGDIGASFSQHPADK